MGVAGRQLSFQVIEAARLPEGVRAAISAP
jgi:hypothetical protein